MPAARGGRAAQRVEVEPPDLPEHLDEPDGSAHQSLGPGAALSSVGLVADFVDERAPGLELREVRWSSARLTGAQLSGLLGRDVAFHDCDLSGAVLQDAALTRVEFVRCRLTGLVLSGAALTDVAFTSCRADLLNLRMATGARVRFADCDLREADLYAASCTHLQVYDCDLTGADFTQARIPGVRLHGSRLAALQGVDALHGAVIDPGQQLPLAMELLAAAGVEVSDR